jgi:amidase
MVMKSPQLSRRSFLVAAGGAAIATAAAGPQSRLGLAATGGQADELALLDGIAQAELVRSRKISALELLNASIARVAQVNPQLNAVVTEFLDRARALAKGPLPSSPLSGLPYLVKDLVDVKGERATYGSRLFAKNIAEDNSPAAEAAIKAGMIIFGKTNTPEFGLSPTTEPLQFGPTHNPWKLGYSTGGSSGGAAAAVAAGMVPIAHGTDAGGSLRIPASCCGIFGMKPSRSRMPSSDRLPGDPAVEFCVSRTVRDSAMLLSLSEDRTAHAPLKPVGYVKSPLPERLKITLCTQNMYGEQPGTDVREMLHDTARLCESLGHHVTEVGNPVDGEKLMDALVNLLSQEILQGLQLAKAQHLKLEDVLEPWTLGLAQKAESTSKEQLASSVAYFKTVQQQLEAFMRPYDLWLTPVTFSPAPRIGELAPTVDFKTLKEKAFRYMSYTPVQNVAGIPAMSVPLHWTSEGIPFGSHFSAKLGEEAKLLSLAYELEEARPWRNKRPSVNAF